MWTAVGLKTLTSGTCLPTCASWDWGQARGSRWSCRRGSATPPMRLPAKERTTSKCAAAHVSSDRSFVDVMCPMWIAAVVCSHAVDVHDVRARYVHARQGCGVAADVNGRRLRIVDVRREAVGIKKLTSGTCLPTRASWDWGQARAPWSHANASFGVGWP